MTYFNKISLLFLFNISSSHAFVINIADFNVTGNISQSACIPSFSDGGTVNYGVIPTASLSQALTTQLATKSITYSIICGASYNFGILWSDAKNGSGVLDGAFPASVFGLGKQGAAAIGRYSLNYSRFGTTGDGIAVDLIYQDSGGAWVKNTVDAIAHDYPRTYSYAELGTLIPAAYAHIAGTINVTVAVAATDTLNLSEPLTLDGLSVMTIRYL